MSVKKTGYNRRLVRILPAVLVLAASLIAFYKIYALGYDLDAIAPSESYHLEIVMEYSGHGSGVRVDMALPRTLPNQSVSGESVSSEDLQFETYTRDGDRRGVWSAEAINGPRTIGYSVTVVTKNRRFVIDSTLPVSQEIPRGVQRYLIADSAIQSDSPTISRLADSLGLSADSTMLSAVSAIYDYAKDGLRYVRYSGTTDAVTACRLGEASCGGKSRIMAALARHMGIPARLVGGKILSSGESRATHIWVEFFIHGHWVPFCPTNGYVAEIPSNYLVLYYGDHSFLNHTRDINFRYYFNLKKRLVGNAGDVASLAKSPMEMLNIWSTFKRVAISLELLKIIIMLPVGVLAVVVFRNLIGVQTFGTFMPALIAIGFRDTGLWRGMLLFSVILLFGASIRWSLRRLQLLHTPRLAIILTGVVLFMLGLTAFGVQLGWLDLARVALFPMVILTLTVERFSIVSEEYGLGEAALVSVMTMLVAAAAYSLMEWRLLQSVVISFPETILLLVAIYIYIGRYSGFRLVEYSRFRHLAVRT